MVREQAPIPIAHGPRTCRSVQQRSTAATALSNTFGFIQARPGERKRAYKRLLRGVRDEEVAGSNPVTPTSDVTLWRHP